MSKSGDDKPLAPRRSLSRSPGRPDGASAQPVMRRSYAEPAAASTVTEPPTGSGSAQDSHAGQPPPEFPVPPVAKVSAARATTEPTSHTAAQAPTHAAQPHRSSRTRTIRRARLRLMRVDPWSVTKTSFLLSIAFGIMCVVAVFLVFSIMTAAGLWTHINQTVQVVLSQQPGQKFNISNYVGMSRVMGVTMLIAAVDVVLITALSTLGAFIYNMAASLLGGVEVTLAEDLK